MKKRKPTDPSQQKNIPMAMTDEQLAGMGKRIAAQVKLIGMLKDEKRRTDQRLGDGIKGAEEKLQAMAEDVARGLEDRKQGSLFSHDAAGSALQKVADKAAKAEAKAAAKTKACSCKTAGVIDVKCPVHSKDRKPDKLSGPLGRKKAVAKKAPKKKAAKKKTRSLRRGPDSDRGMIKT